MANASAPLKVSCNRIVSGEGNSAALSGPTG
jgi:hypothetical protein